MAVLSLSSVDLTKFAGCSLLSVLFVVNPGKLFTLSGSWGGRGAAER